MMKTTIRISILALLTVFFYLAGSWRSQNRIQSEASTQKALYYMCPMHPTFRSDKPGVAPCCGMEMEPVYSENHKAGTDSGHASAAGIHIEADRQQLMGLRTGTVQRSFNARSLRILGRVAADETRVYKIIAPDSGWIREIYPNTVGSFVRRDQPLAAFYATPALQGALLTYVNTLNLVSQNPASNGELPGQAVPAETRIQAAADALRNLGVSDFQIAELTRTRKPMKNILVCSPESGFVTIRNVSLGQRFVAGEELYRIVNLSRVWVLADLFENEAGFLRPGLSAEIRYPALGRTLAAKVSEVLPQFDSASRTLKVRLETDNPEFFLRPDMFVDVQLSIPSSNALTIPAEALLDTGLRKMVFVDCGNGAFEAREIQVGWRSNGSVEVKAGLEEGEKIVVSGNFLLDSESRMRQVSVESPSKTLPVADGHTGRRMVDPVCGMTVEVNATTLRSVHLGHTYYFCLENCKRRFESNPSRYLAGKTVS